MAASPVTPVALNASVITTGGTAVNATVGPVLNGGFLVNPASATDQAISNAEDICINPVGAAANPSGALNGTNFRISPGQAWQFIPGQTTNTSMNASTSNHAVSGIQF